jgi:hypothetical protein
MNEITKKWLDIGFLCGMTDPYLMEKLAFKYEEVSKLMLNDNQPLISIEQDRLETVIFPVLRRVYGQYNNVNTKHLYQDFKNWITDNYQRIEEASRKAINGIDVEAEETANYCEYYIERFKTVITPIQYLDRHKV